MKHYLPDHFADDLKGFKTLSFVTAGSFDQFSMLIKKFYKTKWWRLSTRMLETS